MELNLLLSIAIRTTIVYTFLFAVVRILGKRNLGLHSAFDLIVAILLANLASDAIFGSVTLFHSLFAVGIVAGWHLLGRHWSARNPQIHRFLTHTPVVLVRDGEMVPHALRAERLPEEELMSLLRERNIDELAEVKLAILEPSGQLSVVRQDWAREARLGDLRAWERGGI